MTKKCSTTLPYRLKRWLVVSHLDPSFVSWGQNQFQQGLTDFSFEQSAVVTLNKYKIHTSLVRKKAAHLCAMGFTHQIFIFCVLSFPCRQNVNLNKLLSAPGSFRLAWRWRGSTWGTSFTTITPNVACGTGRWRPDTRDHVTCCCCTMTRSRHGYDRGQHSTLRLQYDSCCIIGDACWLLPTEVTKDLQGIGHCHVCHFTWEILLIFSESHWMHSLFLSEHREMRTTVHALLSLLLFMKILLCTVMILMVAKNRPGPKTMIFFFLLTCCFWENSVYVGLFWGTFRFLFLWK